MRKISSKNGVLMRVYSRGCRSTVDPSPGISLKNYPHEASNAEKSRKLKALKVGSSKRLARSQDKPFVEMKPRPQKDSSEPIRSGFTPQSLLSVNAA